MPAPIVTHKGAENAASSGEFLNIRTILIANNGMAAVKFIHSIQSWCKKEFDSANYIKLCALASQDDIDSCSEFIHLCDSLVRVVGGPNRFNYANVDLIVDTAIKNDCDVPKHNYD